VAVDFLTEFDDVQIIEPENPKALSSAIKNLHGIENLTKNIRNQELIREKYQREEQVRKVLDLVCLLCEK